MNIINRYWRKKRREFCLKLEYLYPFNVFLANPLLLIIFGIIFCILIYNYISDNSSSTSHSIKTYEYLVKNSSDECRWIFDHYSKSAWEMYWYNNISTLQNNVCPRLIQTDQMVKSIRSLEYIIDLQKQIFYEPVASENYDDVLSKMFYRYECSKTSEKNVILVSQYIEPLIGLLRDPLTICSYESIPPNLTLEGENAMQSKRFFLLGPSAPYENFRASTKSIPPWLYKPGSQKILFDIGCSLFKGIDNDTGSSPLMGARWFYQYFSLNSLKFDRILAFDRAPYPSSTFWRQIPDDLMGIFTYINVAVETSGKFHPWNILKNIAKIDDYVIIKLDIDTSHLENEFMKQILNDKSISSLIDEMFFEMHVTVNEMKPFWLQPPGELKDTYVLFTKLRELGIRMHSWP